MYKKLINKNTINIITNMNTFKELYEFLKNNESNDIYSWLEQDWIGKDKQESLLRLFAKLNLVSKLNNYNICDGNFNLNTLTISNNVNDLFYNSQNNEIKLKDNGDSSDLTCISKDNKEILAISSKNLKSYNIGKLDIGKINLYSKQYENKYNTRIGLCVRSCGEITETINNAKNTTTLSIKKYLNNLIVIDWDDLNDSYKLFKSLYGDKNIKEILLSEMPILTFRPHQQLSINKTLQLKKNKESQVLWGHIPRSGKSYIMCGVIIFDSIGKPECNYLIITTAPNETIDQYFNILKCKSLQDFNIIRLKTKSKTCDINLLQKNVIVCSKQFLDGKNIKKLKDLKFDIRFIDEVHNGACTELSQKTLKSYGPKTFTVFITATYFKPIQQFNIKNKILWDLEDVNLCKNYNETNKNILVSKHGDEVNNIFNNYTDDKIKNEYLHYPNLNILSEDIDLIYKQYIIDRTIDNNYGWSVDACFTLNDSDTSFQNENECINLWKRLLGDNDDLIDNNAYIDRITKQIKATNNQRLIHNTINPGIIMCFMPVNDNLDKKCQLTKKLLDTHFKYLNYEICIINSKITNDAKNEIENSRKIAINTGKCAVLVLSGRQASLGITIQNCDVVILLNNSKSFDLIYQMMFRCMTESYDVNYPKYDGFVIDLNIHRVIQQIFIEYASILKPKLNTKDAIKYLLRTNIIKFNKDKLIRKNEDFVEKYSNKIYQIYTKNTETAISHYLKKISNKCILLDNADTNTIMNLFELNKKNYKKEEIILEDRNTGNINNDIEKILLNNNIEEKEEIIIENKCNIIDIIKHIIPLICILTIKEPGLNTFNKMFIYIKDNNELYDILLNQFKIWWEKDIKMDEFDKLNEIFNKYLSLDGDINNIVEVIKDIFVQAKDNTDELSKLVDKYLIPQELEKKKNAEVSTPYKLRNEMLDKVPEDFWKSPKKVFEPCSGKGGFLVDIVNRFSKHLDYKTIVEQCLYFSDINPTNIYINKLLFNFRKVLENITF